MALKINVPVVKGEASAINGYVAEYKKEIGKIYLTIAELKQGWEGEANSTYTKKTDDCKPELDQLGEKIDAYANWLTDAATTIERVDDGTTY